MFQRKALNNDVRHNVVSIMANSIERMGVSFCEHIAEKMGWMFREQPIDDIGIDAHMEVTDKNGKEKQLLALQIKSGESYFSENRENYIVFRDINDRQYNYWTTNTLPCIVVLYNPNNDMCIWQKLTVETIQKTRGGTGNGYYVKVPKNQVFLDETSNIELLTYTNLPLHITNYNFLLSQKRFMQIIQDGGIVKLHSEEWVNKCSGKGKTELIVNDGNGIETYSYPYWFPFTQYTDVFPRLFPWADFSVDEDFYEENDMVLWRELHCFYDKDEDEWLEVGETFEEFRKSLDPIRSVDHFGEVAEFMLVLSLNELGRSFLSIDEYVSQQRPYVNARIVEE